MKRKYLTFLSLILLTACNKDNKKQYSTWYVNDEMFRTNDVKLTKGKAKHIFNSKDIDNKFDIEFNLGHFPSDDKYLINCSQKNPAWVCVTINYKHVSYDNPKTTYLQAGMHNKKFRYTLEPAWFYNVSDANDSILVKGEFNEP